jgi:hypothetical protein
MITIAYSVNGGFTPIRYRCLADEIAFYLAPGVFGKRYRRHFQAGVFFNHFLESGTKNSYWKAFERDAYYRCPDNNYGPLYLEKSKVALAREEFAKVNSVDPDNPGSLWGLGECALRCRDYALARRYLSKAWANCRSRVFSKLRPAIIYSLAFAQYGSGDLFAAQSLLERYCRMRPLDSRGYYWLGVISQREKRFNPAIRFYQDSVRLGYLGVDPLCRLAKIFATGPGKSDIISFVKNRISVLRRKTGRLVKSKTLSTFQLNSVNRDRLKLERAWFLLRKS